MLKKSDGSRHREPVDMDVERGHKNTYLYGGSMEKNILVHIFHHDYRSIGGRDNEGGTLGRRSLRVAEEIEGKQEECNSQSNQGIFYIGIIKEKARTANKKQANRGNHIEDIVAIFCDQIINSGG